MMKTVLRGFLGTFTSRHPDYDGYWIFGYVVESLDVLSIDLLADAPVPDSPQTALLSIAGRTFAEQLAKAGLERSQVASAVLTLHRGEPHDCDACGVPLPLHGWWITFDLVAVMDNGRTYSDGERVCVAPQSALSTARQVLPST
jgi:hypothetical protein